MADVASPTQGQSPIAINALQNIVMAIYNLSNTLTNNYISNTLTSGHLLVGNASNAATDVAVSGDATLIASGALTVVSVGGKKIARGIQAVTGTFDLNTTLGAAVAGFALTLAEDPSLQATLVSGTVGVTGHVTLKVWKPTSSSDTTPIASTNAKNVAWIAWS